MPAKSKIKEVEELTKKLSSSAVIAIADINKLPSKQMQEIRRKLHGKVEIKVVKNRLLRLAIKDSKVSGLDKLGELVSGQTALIFSDSNPFSLYQEFIKSRVNAPAKAGDVAPMDIIVPAGDTPFKPGPIIGDLQQVGIKAKVQGPIIAVIADSPVIKEGEEFSAQLANVLSQMDIKPMVIGINIRAALEKGMVYGKDILNIDAEQTLTDILTAHQNALNLAVEAGIYNKESTPVMLTKAAAGARNLALEAEIYNAETVDFFLSKADGQAKGLAASASYEPDAAPKAEEKAEEKPAEEAPKEEKPAEEKKEEAPKEEVAEEPKAEEKPAEETPAEEPAKEKAEEPKPEEKTDDTTQSS